MPDLSKIDEIQCIHAVDQIRFAVENIINETTYNSNIPDSDFNRLCANLTLYITNTMWTHADEIVGHYRSMLGREKGKKR